MNSKTRSHLLALCECSVFIGLAMVLNLIKIDVAWLQGGSISFAMLPLFVLSSRRGLYYGIAAGAVFGLLDLLMSGDGLIFGWALFLDYLFAFGAIGFAGIFKKHKYAPEFGVLFGGLMRYLIHTLSGVLLYREYVQAMFGISFDGNSLVSSIFYSIIYNISYMLPSILACLLAIMLIHKADKRIVQRQK